MLNEIDIKKAVVVDTTSQKIYQDFIWRYCWASDDCNDCLINIFPQNRKIVSITPLDKGKRNKHEISNSDRSVF